VVLLTSCGGYSRPDRIIEPGVVGLVSDADRSIDTSDVFQVGDQTVEFDPGDAVVLTGSGVGVDDLLLHGEDFGRTWYASLDTWTTLYPPDCYVVIFAAAFDEPEAVVFVFSEWREVGLRLPKREDFNPPEAGVSGDTGQYLVGDESAGGANHFCLDVEGQVVGVP
jgi:hypothetical protein